MKKLLLLFIPIILLGAGCVANNDQQTTTQNQQQQIDSLNKTIETLKTAKKLQSKPIVNSNLDSLDLENTKQCATSSKKMFNDLNLTANGGTADFENHFNKKLNKCFILLKTSLPNPDNNNLFLGNSLFDVYENKVHAEFDVLLDKNGNQVNQVPICTVENTKCINAKDFETMINPYMTE